MQVKLWPHRLIIMYTLVVIYIKFNQASLLFSFLNKFIILEQIRIRFVNFISKKIDSSENYKIT